MFSIVVGESAGYYKLIKLRRFDKKRVVGIVSVYIVMKTQGGFKTK